LRLFDASSIGQWSLGYPHFKFAHWSAVRVLRGFIVPATVLHRFFLVVAIAVRGPTLISTSCTGMGGVRNFYRISRLASVVLFDRLVGY